MWKLLYVMSGAVRQVKFETILKYYDWYLSQISRTNHAIICLYYFPQKVCNFHMQVFQIKLKYHCSKPIKLQKFLMQQDNIYNVKHDSQDFLSTFPVSLPVLFIARSFKLKVRERQLQKFVKKSICHKRNVTFQL